MVKAAFFDIDGTLVSFRTHRISKGTELAIRMLRKKGIHTFIATGRPNCLIPTMPVAFDGFVTMNGGYCFIGEDVVYKNPIPMEESLLWLKYARANDICTLVFTDHEMFVNTLCDPVANALSEEIKFSMPPLLSLEEMSSKEAYQFIAVMNPDRDKDVLSFLPNCRLPRWHPKFADLIQANNSKAVGIESIIRPLGISRQECICFGDGANDIEMLEYCGMGVAMGNAEDVVKAHADLVTTSVDEEGIAHALHELRII